MAEPGDRLTFVQGCVAEGEQLHWSGQPSYRPEATPLQGLIYLAAAIGTVGLIALIVATMIANPDRWYYALAIPVILYFAYAVTFGERASAQARRNRIAYAITDLRLIIVSGSRPPVVTSLPWATLDAPIIHRQRNDGNGEIYFPLLSGNDWLQVVPDDLKIPAPRRDLPRYGPLLEGVADARRVYQIARQAQDAALGE